MASFFLWKERTQCACHMTSHPLSAWPRKTDLSITLPGPCAVRIPAAAEMQRGGDSSFLSIHIHAIPLWWKKVWTQTCSDLEAMWMLYHRTVDVGSEFCKAMHVLLVYMATAGGWGLLWWGGRIERIQCRKKTWRNNGWKLPKFGERKTFYMWSWVNLKQDKCKEIPDIMPRHHKQIAENLRKKKSWKMMH